VPIARPNPLQQKAPLFDHLVGAGERDEGISRPSIPGGLAWMTNSRTWWMLNNQGSGTHIP